MRSFEHERWILVRVSRNPLKVVVVRDVLFAAILSLQKCAIELVQLARVVVLPLRSGDKGERVIPGGVAAHEGACASGGHGVLVLDRGPVFEDLISRALSRIAFGASGVFAAGESE